MIDNMWENVKRTLDYKNIDNFIAEEKKNATMNKGLVIFAMAILLASLVSFLATLASAYMMDNTVETLSTKYQVSNIPGKLLTQDFIKKSAITFLLVGIPLGFVVVFLAQKGMYLVMKTMKSQGKFEEQFYMMAQPALTQSIASPSLLFLMVPCANIISLFGFLGLSLYLIFFVQGKIMKELHGTSWMVALGTIILGNILSAVVYFGIMQLLVYFGLYPTLPGKIDIQVGG